MEPEANVINALGDAAQTLAQEIAFCSQSAERCLQMAWEAGRERHEVRETLLRQAENFIRLSGEVAASLAKLKGDGNTHRQHISVERIEHSGPPPSRAQPASPPKATEMPVGLIEPDERDPAHEAAERARAAQALAAFNAELRARGEGGGADSGKQLDAVAANGDPTS